MKYKTAELEGGLLDRAVAMAYKCHVPVQHEPHIEEDYFKHPGDPISLPLLSGEQYEPSNRWDHGGPIIERERIKLLPPQADRSRWLAEVFQGKPHFGWAESDAPLIAAMRAFVASMLGEEVEIP